MASITEVPAGGGGGGGGGGGTGTACIISMVNSGSVGSHRYYLARRTLIEMLRDRGYEVTDVESELCRSLDDFHAAFGEDPDPERLRLVASRVSDPSRAIMAIFCGPFEIKKQAILGIMSQILNKETLDRVIVVPQRKINYRAQKVLDDYSVKVEIFQITDLLVNITKHFLLPKHEILTTEEKDKLLKKYSIKDKQLPLMLADDAIARYYGLEKGQVVKVTYSGDTTGLLITYRGVV